MFAPGAAIILRLHLAAVILLDVSPLFNPRRARARETLFNVNRHRRIGVGAGGVIDRHGRLVRRGVKIDLAYGHADVFVQVARDINLARRGKRTRGHFRGFEFGLVYVLVHF